MSQELKKEDKKSYIQKLADNLYACQNQMEKGMKTLQEFLKAKRAATNLKPENIAKTLNITEASIYCLEENYHIYDKQKLDKLIYFYQNYKTENISKQKEFYTDDGFAKPEAIPKIIKYYRKLTTLNQIQLSQNISKKTNEFTENTINTCENSVSACTLIRRYWISRELMINFKKLCVNQEELDKLINFDNVFKEIEKTKPLKGGDNYG